MFRASQSNIASLRLAEDTRSSLDVELNKFGCRSRERQNNHVIFHGLVIFNCTNIHLTKANITKKSSDLHYLASERRHYADLLRFYAIPRQCQDNFGYLLGFI
mmetsp:Transcript_28863/g.67705  ORF Transcript_28863/g.67705 Transcript_28863/m.67705 type:complete len:103 (+) Transcript_28863:311-619(+)